MRGRALLLVALMVTMSLSGCFGNEEIIEEPVVEEVKDVRVFVTDKTGESVDVPAIEMTFQFSDVGETGKAKRVPSTGCYFIAMEKVMRSCDYGETWEGFRDNLFIHNRPYVG